MGGSVEIFQVCCCIRPTNFKINRSSTSITCIFLFRCRLVEGVTTVKQFQNLLFNLLLILGNEKSIIEAEVPHLNI